MAQQFQSKKTDNTQDSYQYVKNNEISKGYALIGKLAYSCFIYYPASLRLLATLMQTTNYGTIYKSMISNNPEIISCQKRRPPKSEQEVLLQIGLHKHDLIKQMKVRGITPRQYCQMYGFEVKDLLEPSPELYDYLREDFWEIYNFSPPFYYINRYVIKRISEKSGSKYTFKSPHFAGVCVFCHDEPNGIRIFNTRITQEVIITRLRLLNSDGIASAMNYRPAFTEIEVFENAELMAKEKVWQLHCEKLRSESKLITQLRTEYKKLKIKNLSQSNSDWNIQYKMKIDRLAEIIEELRSLGLNNYAIDDLLNWG